MQPAPPEPPAPPPGQREKRGREKRGRGGRERFPSSGFDGAVSGGARRIALGLCLPLILPLMNAVGAFATPPRAAVEGAPAAPQSTLPKSGVSELRFEVPGTPGQAPPVARVEVARISRKPKSARFFSWISPAKGRSVYVAEGVHIRLQNNDFWGLQKVPAALREKSRVKNLELQHLNVYAPGDTVPSLIAKEVKVQADGVWKFHRVLLSGLPSLPSCTLRFTEKEDLVLRAPARKPISLKKLLLNSKSL